MKFTFVAFILTLVFLISVAEYDHVYGLELERNDNDYMPTAKKSGSRNYGATAAYQEEEDTDEEVTDAPYRTTKRPATKKYQLRNSKKPVKVVNVYEDEVYPEATTPKAKPYIGVNGKKKAPALTINILAYQEPKAGYYR